MKGFYIYANLKLRICFLKKNVDCLDTLTCISASYQSIAVMTSFLLQCLEILRELH